MWLVASNHGSHTSHTSWDEDGLAQRAKIAHFVMVRQRKTGSNLVCSWVQLLDKNPLKANGSPPPFFWPGKHHGGFLQSPEMSSISDNFYIKIKPKQLAIAKRRLSSSFFKTKKRGEKKRGRATSGRMPPWPVLVIDLNQISFAQRCTFHKCCAWTPQISCHCGHRSGSQI